MRNLKKNEGITLIALVITIIVLLILAGVSLSLVMGNEGILGRATNAVDKSQQAAAEEELNLAMEDMRIEAAKNNEKFDQNYVVEKLPEKLEDCSCGLVEDGIEGEYKDYVFTVDEKYVVQIESKASGIRPEIELEILTTDYVTDGNTVEIQVTATIAEGTVTILAPESMTLSNTTEIEQGKICVYTVNKNGNYAFTAVGDSGRKRSKKIEVQKIIERPIIEITDITMGSVKVNVMNSALEGVTYHYYVDGVVKGQNIAEKSYIIENLNSSTEYTIKVVMTYNGTELVSEDKKVTTSPIDLLAAKDFWKLTDGIGNRIENAGASELMEMGDGEIAFDEEGMKLSGNAYLRTRNNYEFPANFTMLIQVKTSEFKIVGRKWTYRKSIGNWKSRKSANGLAF